jgi:hypothetical protein
MMKIILLMKEYIGLHIYIYEVLFTHITNPHVRIPPVYGNNKQQQIINIFRGKINVFSFSNKLAFLENPMYTLVYK